MNWLDWGQKKIEVEGWIEKYSMRDSGNEQKIMKNLILKKKNIKVR